MKVNIQKITKYLFFLSIPLMYGDLSMGLSCSESLTGRRQPTPFLPPVFLVSIDNLITNASTSQLPTDLFQVAAKNLVPIGVLKTDTAHFYETYRANSRYMEEYSTSHDRQKDPFPITRFHSHYRWLVDRMLEISYGTQSSSKTIKEMAMVNQWIVESQNQGIPPGKSIRDLNSEIIGTPELRVATYLQLKFTNQSLSRETSVTSFKEIQQAIMSSTVTGDKWAKLNAIVERTKGRVDYLQAIKALEAIEHFQNQVATSAFKDPSLLVLTMDRMGLPINVESLSTLENAYHRATQMNENLPANTLTPELFLRYYAIAPDAMKLKNLSEVLEFVTSESAKLIDNSFKHEKLSATSAITLLYLSRLPANEGQFLQLSLLHRCIKDYNTVFKTAKTVSWIYEDLFANTLIP